MSVLSFGSLNIDYVYSVDHFVSPGETLSAKALHVYIGGKGLNQSIALARTGISVYHAGAIGTDGRFLIEALEKAGVNTEYVSVLDDVRTGNAIIQKDIKGNNCILLYGGANQAIERAQIDNVFTHFTQADYLLIQNEINHLPYIVEKAKNIGMKIVLNPSPMDEKIFALPLHKIDYFILNEIEAFQILGEEFTEAYDGKQLAEKLRNRWEDATIILTMGGKGSICLNHTEYIEQPIYKVEVMDTTAAGDTFTGYFLGSLLSGKTLRDSMNMAAKAAAIAVSREGAAPSIPCKAEVEALIYV
ncbi:ribokinase [Hominifimenecus sp. rT4P-3]|uniref:ribokinase n=1 Tax=Hominifimenecus sp. rT4P-3 TaxID=3242979 RepID=UPI003DA4B86A